MTSFKKLLLLAPLPMLASCMTTRAQPTGSTRTLVPLSTPAPTPTSATKVAPAIDPLCSQVRTVELSRLDTTGTKEQVEANNAVLAKVCGLK